MILGEVTPPRRGAYGGGTGGGKARSSAPPRPTATSSSSGQENFHRRNAPERRVADGADRKAPPGKEARPARGRSFDARRRERGRVRDRGSDANDEASAKTGNGGSQERRVLELPKNFKSLHLNPDGTIDIRTSASSEWDDGISIDVSVLSAASKAPASSVATNGSTSGNKPPLVGAQSDARCSAKLRRASGRGRKSLDDKINPAGDNSRSGTKASKAEGPQRKKTDINDSRSAYLSKYGASTVATEATSLHSVPQSWSNDSLTSKRSAASKGLDRLKAAASSSEENRRRNTSSGGSCRSYAKASKAEGATKKANLHDSKSGKAKSKKVLIKKNAHLTEDNDASTVTTDATSFRSNDTQTSKRSSSLTSKELDFIKRFSKPKRNISDDASVSTEGYEVSILPNKSEISESKKLEDMSSKKKWERKSLEYFKGKKNGHGNSSSNGVGKEEVNGNDSRSSRSASTGRVETRNGRGNISSRTVDVCTDSKSSRSVSTGRAERIGGRAANANMSKTTGRTNGTKTSATEKETKPIRDPSAGYRKNIPKRGGSARSASTGRTEEESEKVVKKASAAGKTGKTGTHDRAENTPPTVVSRRARLRGRSLTRSRPCAARISGGGNDDREMMHAIPSQECSKTIGSNALVVSSTGQMTLTPLGAISNGGDHFFPLAAKTPQPHPYFWEELLRGDNKSVPRTQPHPYFPKELPKGDNKVVVTRDRGEAFHPSAPASASETGERKKATRSARNRGRRDNRYGKDNVAAAVAPVKKKAVPPIDNNSEVSDTVAMLHRARQRRSSSLPRSSRVHPSERSCSFPKRVDAQSSSSKKSKETSPQIPPRKKGRKGMSAAAKHPCRKMPPRTDGTTTLTKVTTRTTNATNEVTAPTTRGLPIRKHGPGQRRSASLPPWPRSKYKEQEWGALLVSRCTVNFDILKPSKLASFSIAVLCKAAIPIQCLARHYLAKVAVVTRKKSIVVVQSLIRRRVCMTYLKSAQTIALRCQGVYQGMGVREDLNFQHYCASRIQAVFRGFSGILAFVEELSKIILLQSIWRMKHQRKRYITWKLQEQREIQVTLAQSIVRRWIALESYKEQRETNAALMIQTNFRRHMAKLSFLYTVDDVVLCQAAVRRFLALKHAETLKSNKEQRETKAALMIQTNFRRHIAKLAFLFTVEDVVLCQAAVRRFLALKHAATLSFERDTNAALLIQTNFRRHRAMDDLLYEVMEVILCQAAVRRFLAMKQVATLRYKRDTKAALFIQTNFRRHRAMVDTLDQIMGVIVCQATVRQFLALKHVATMRNMRDNKAALLIQTNFRRRRAMVDFLYLVTDVISCQAAVRRFLVMKHAKTLNMRDGNAALMIQKNFRRHRAMVDIFYQVLDVILCQATVRQYLALKYTTQLRQLRQVKCATKIQATWRVCLTAKRLIFENNAVTVIQTRFRGYREFLSFAIKNVSVIRIQACMRGYFAKRLLNRLKQEKMELEQLILQNAASTAIQSCFRGYQGFTLFLVKSFSIVQIQVCVRGHQARRHLQILKQEKQEEKRMVLQNTAATAIQSCFRGYRDFVTFVIVQYFIMKIQACVRCHQAQRVLKQLKKKDRDKKIKKNRRLSDKISRVSSAQMKKNRPRDSLLSSYNSHKKHNSRGMELPEQREKRSALVIERFFIKIRAEIELEIRRLEQKEKGRTNRPSSRKEKMLNRSREPPSAEHPHCGLKYTTHSCDPPRKAANGAVASSISEERKGCWSGADSSKVSTNKQSNRTDAPANTIFRAKWL